MSSDIEPQGKRKAIEDSESSETEKKIKSAPANLVIQEASSGAEEDTVELDYSEEGDAEEGDAEEGDVKEVEEKEEEFEEEDADDEDNEDDEDYVPSGDDENEDQEDDELKSGPENGFVAEPPLSNNEFMAALSGAADASDVFAQVYYPVIKAAIPSIGKFKIPWREEPKCTNERFCVDNSCDSQNQYPAWAWHLMRCQSQALGNNDCGIDVTFEPVTAQIYVIYDASRYQQPIKVPMIRTRVLPSKDTEVAESQKKDAEQVAARVKERLSQLAKTCGGFTRDEDAV